MIDKSKLKKVCIYNKEETISNKILNLQNSKEKKIEIQSSKLKTFKIAVPSKVSKYTSLEKLKQIISVGTHHDTITGTSYPHVHNSEKEIFKKTITDLEDFLLDSYCLFI